MAYFIREEFMNEVLFGFPADSEYRTSFNTCGFQETLLIHCDLYVLALDVPY